MAIAGSTRRSCSRPTIARKSDPVEKRPAAVHRAPIVLASASPRRHMLLARAGVTFEAWPADLDEAPRRGEPPGETIARLARAKAAAVAAEIAEPGRLVLGADTGV